MANAESATGTRWDRIEKGTERVVSLRTIRIEKEKGKKTYDPTGKLDVLRHDGHALGVHGAEVGVLEKPDQVGLGRLLQRADRSGLEPEVGLEVLGDLADEALERELADEELGRPLVPVAPNWSQDHREVNFNRSGIGNTA